MGGIAGGPSTLDTGWEGNLVKKGSSLNFTDIHLKITIITTQPAGFSWGSVSLGVDADEVVGVPEPLTMLGSAAAVGFMAAFNRRLAKVTKEKKNS